MKRNRILVIDNEKEIVELIEVYLKKEDYKIFKAYNGKEALEVLESEPIDLAILDIMMPEMDGLEVCRRLRAQNNYLPVIFLSAKSQDFDKISGLGAGGDDYMVKPFNPLELMARVKAQLRRYTYMEIGENADWPEETLCIKGLSINRATHKVTLSGLEIHLTPTEYDILLLLAGNRGRIFNAEEIFETVWKENCYEANNTVSVHMWRLREKIEDNPKAPKIIETVWGVGYRIEK